STGAPNGIIHRDIKPSNIRITPEGKAILIDFGIARPFAEDDLTQGVGTHMWRAPEVLGPPGNPGPHSDTWALGALAYWIVTGSPPRLEGAAAAREALIPILRESGLPDAKGLAGLIASTLEIQPEKRPN